MREWSSARTSMELGAFSTPRLAQIYLVWAASLSLLYLSSPVISYLVFWDILPKVSLTLFLSVLLIPTFVIRLLLLLSDQLRFASRGLLLSFILLAWISILQFLWYPTVSTQLGQEDVLSTLALTFVVSWVLWLGGESLAFLLAQGLRWKWMVGIAYLCLICIVAYGLIKGFSIYGFLTLALQKPFSGEFYNYYIPLSDSLAIISLLLMGVTQPNKFYPRVGIYAFTATLLLFTFSRASLILFLIAGLTMLWMGSYQKYKRWSLLCLAVGAILLVSLLTNSLYRDVGYFKGIYYSIERVENIFAGTDLSSQRRVELLKEGLKAIKRYWLLGCFMNEAVESGKGTYIHNWLSFWISYGIGPFLLSLWCTITLLTKCWHMRRRSLLSPSAFSLLLFSFLAIISARSYIWPYIWLTIGFAGVVSGNRLPFSTRKVLYQGDNL